MKSKFGSIVFGLLLIASESEVSAQIQNPDSQGQVGDRFAELVDRVSLPFETFTLANGLRVVVHEDRQAPVVAVSIWYNVGSKDEPAGRTGFAHLFEHLMFSGSENAPGDYFLHAAEMGATSLNGTTSTDRTNYFQTVPTGSLERALFLESDRMGHLLGALTQANLANQVGVVQNEKRQGDNRPYGMVQYAVFEGLFPEGHPYRHPTIGSMADLSAATLDTARQWFRDNYGPNNAVLVLVGDINASEARPLVERYFGSIRRGRVNRPAQAVVPTLPRRFDRELHDHVSNPQLLRAWAVPGLTDSDIAPLTVASQVLGGLASSRLNTSLVRGEQKAVRVSSNVLALHRVSVFSVNAFLRPGQDVSVAGRRLDQIIEDFVRDGPTQEEVDRAVMRILSQRVQELEQLGGFRGRAVSLAEGMLYADDPGFYRAEFRRLARTTPTEVRQAMQRWLRRPIFALTISPGDREPYQEPAGAPSAAVGRTEPASRPQTREARQPPPIVASRPLDFPPIERGRLSNGIEVIFARRTGVPVTRLGVEFNAGAAADAPGRAGIQNMMLDLLSAGTASLDASQIAETQERLGASISASAGDDRTSVGMVAISTNLGPSLDLLVDMVRNPAFAPAEVERLRHQRLANIAEARNRPEAVARDVLRATLYGDHPYGRSEIGDESAIRAVTRDDIIHFYNSWIRPDNARVFIVSDQSLSQLLPILEDRFGDWSPPSHPLGVKAFNVPLPPPRQRIILIDRPQSSQSVITVGQVLSTQGTKDNLALNAASEVLAGDFLSRINMDLRERRGWSYGTSGGIITPEHQPYFFINAPVQTDRTGESIMAIREQIRAFLQTDPVQADELSRVVANNTRTLPGRYQTSGQVLGALVYNTLLRRPENYLDTISDRYFRLTSVELDQAARHMLMPDTFVWVVVGDAVRVRPQLEQLGLPIEVRTEAQPAVSVSTSRW